MAYPGRDGAHSAAACDRLFPHGAELGAAPSFTAVVAAATRGDVHFGGPADRELAHRPRRRDARLALRLVALDHRRDRSHPPLPRRRRGRPARGDPRRPLASRRARPVPPPARRACRGRRRSPPRRPPTPPTRSPSREDPAEAAIASERAAQMYGLAVSRGDVGRPSRGVHALRLGRPVHAARPRAERVADGLLVHHRPRAGRAPPRDRALRAPQPRPRSARLAADPGNAVALPLRRRPRRASARRGRQRDARRGPGADAGSSACSARIPPTGRGRKRGGRPGWLRDGLVAGVGIRC